MLKTFFLIRKISPTLIDGTIKNMLLFFLGFFLMHNLSYYKNIIDINNLAEEGNLSVSDLKSQDVLSGRWLPVVQRRRYG